MVHCLDVETFIGKKLLFMIKSFEVLECNKASQVDQFHFHLFPKCVEQGMCVLAVENTALSTYLQ